MTTQKIRVCLKSYDHKLLDKSTSEIVDTVREPLLILDDRLRVVSGNESYYRTFQETPADAVGRAVYDLGNGQWNSLELRERIEQILPGHSEFVDFLVEHDFPAIGKRKMMLSGRRLEEAITLPGKILLAIEDVTDRDS